MLRDGPRRPPGGHRGPGDAADQVAGVALARREVLLRVHAHRLRREDLEDAYSQATLELLTGARRGRKLEDATHIANALEQRFLSRVGDRRRALAGRSPMEAALGHALTLDEPGGGVAQVADPSPGVCEDVTTRIDLARLRETLADLSDDQRLVLACQLGDMQCAEFCERFRWTPEKFRKVAQRARARLLELQGEYASGARCRRLEADLAAHAAGVAEALQARRVERHLANCTACRRRVRELALTKQAALGLAPAWMPSCAVELLRSRAVGAAHAPSAVVTAAARGAAAGSAGAGGGVAAAGGTGIATVKLGLIALCVAGVAGGGVALCPHPRHRPRSAPVSPPASVAKGRAPAHGLVRPREVGRLATAGLAHLPPAPRVAEHRRRGGRRPPRFDDRGATPATARPAVGETASVMAVSPPAPVPAADAVAAGSRSPAPAARHRLTTAAEREFGLAGGDSSPVRAVTRVRHVAEAHLARLGGRSSVERVRAAEGRASTGKAHGDGGERRHGARGAAEFELRPAPSAPARTGPAQVRRAPRQAEQASSGVPAAAASATPRDPPQAPAAAASAAETPAPHAAATAAVPAGATTAVPAGATTASPAGPTTAARAGQRPAAGRAPSKGEFAFESS